MLGMTSWTLPSTVVVAGCGIVALFWYQAPLCVDSNQLQLVLSSVDGSSQLLRYSV
jgi:hypothetical protein